MRNLSKKTILLTTALLSMNFAVATDHHEERSVTEIALPQPQFEIVKRLGIKDITDQKTIEVFTKTLNLLGLLDDQKSNTDTYEAQVFQAAFRGLDEQFNQYQSRRFEFPIIVEDKEAISLRCDWVLKPTEYSVWGGLKYPWVNAANQAVIDNIYETILEPQKILSRIESLNDKFQVILDITKDSYNLASENKNDSKASEKLIEKSIETFNTAKLVYEREKLKFRNAFFDFILTHEVIKNLWELKDKHERQTKTEKDIKRNNSVSTKPQVSDDARANDTDNSKIINDISERIVGVEAFIHSLYPYSRGTVETLLNKLTLGSLPLSKSNRLQITGIQDLSKIIEIPLSFDVSNHPDLDDKALELTKNFYGIMFANYGNVSSTNFDEMPNFVLKSAFSNHYLALVFDKPTAESTPQALVDQLSTNNETKTEVEHDASIASSKEINSFPDNEKSPELTSPLVVQNQYFSDNNTLTLNYLNAVKHNEKTKTPKRKN